MVSAEATRRPEAQPCEISRFPATKAAYCVEDLQMPGYHLQAFLDLDGFLLNLAYLLGQPQQRLEFFGEPTGVVVSIAHTSRTGRWAGDKKMGVKMVFPIRYG